jgi:uncharacterized protein YodC (DUF2158 family)
MATQRQFKPGDLVELNSGGPVMTVNERQSGDEYYCQWFAGKKLDHGTFPLASLKPAVVKPVVPLQAPAAEEK